MGYFIHSEVPLEIPYEEPFLIFANVRLPFEEEGGGICFILTRSLIKPLSTLSLNDYSNVLSELRESIGLDDLDFSMYAFSDREARYYVGSSYNAFLRALSLEVERYPVAIAFAVTQLTGSSLFIIYTHRNYDRIVSSYAYSVLDYLPSPKEFEEYLKLMGLPSKGGGKLIEVKPKSVTLRGDFRAKVLASTGGSLVLKVEEWKIKGLEVRDPLELELFERLTSIKLMKLYLGGVIGGSEVTGRGAILRLDYLPLGSLIKKPIVIRFSGEGLVVV